MRPPLSIVRGHAKRADGRRDVFDGDWLSPCRHRVTAVPFTVHDVTARCVICVETDVGLCSIPDGRVIRLDGAGVNNSVNADARCSNKPMRST
jgi:hypothetical protein